MLIKRDIAETILAGAQQVPLIGIIGPRQSGKSTLIKKLFPHHIYLDMQDSDNAAFAKADPKGFLRTYRNQNKQGIIIDEAQYVPELFPQLKVEADNNPQPGYYILSGSQHFLLHTHISESLAGRIYLYVLLPFSIHELKIGNLLSSQPSAQITHGFYPRVYQPQVQFHEYYANYIATYVERDIRSLRNIENLLLFKKFMQLCALQIGNILNYTQLASDCGITVLTAKSWLSLLETSFILFLLPSYHDNLGKRITKSPKLYFYDVGLARALLNLPEELLVVRRNLYGALFENMVIVDIIKNNHNRGERAVYTFFRDSNQNEIDLIIENHGEIVPIEIKSSETISISFFTILVWFNKQLKNPRNPVVVYGGSQKQHRALGTVLPWNMLDELLKA